MIGTFIKTYATAIVAVAVVSGLGLLGGACYWLYSRGAAVEAARCEMRVSSLKADIVIKSAKARAEGEARGEAAAEEAGKDLDVIEAELARERAKPARTVPVPVPLCAIKDQGEADAANNR